MTHHLERAAGRLAFIVFIHSSRTRSALTLRYVSSARLDGARACPGRARPSSVATKRAARRDAEPVLGEARERVADGAHDAGREIALPPNGSMSAPVDRIDRDGVDREVAPREVRRDVVDERDRVGAPPVGVRRLAAQRRHLVGLPVTTHGDRAVLDPGRDDARKDAHDLVRERVGRDVPVATASSREAGRAPSRRRSSLCGRPRASDRTRPSTSFGTLRQE